MHVLGSNCTFDYFALSHSFLGHHGDHVVESSIVADENFQSLSLENVDSEDLTTFFNRHRGLRAFQKPVDFTFAISKQPMMLRWMQDLASRWFLKNTPASGTCRQHPRWFYLAWGWRPRLFIFFLECEAVEKSNTSWKTDDGTWMHMDLATDVRWIRLKQNDHTSHNIIFMSHQSARVWNEFLWCKHRWYLCPVEDQEGGI